MTRAGLKNGCARLSARFVAKRRREGDVAFSTDFEIVIMDYRK
jgi:hypothetical protein